MTDTATTQTSAAPTPTSERSSHLEAAHGLLEQLEASGTVSPVLMQVLWHLQAAG